MPQALRLQAAGAVYRPPVVRLGSALRARGSPLPILALVVESALIRVDQISGSFFAFSVPFCGKCGFSFSAFQLPPAREPADAERAGVRSGFPSFSILGFLGPG